MSGYGTAVSLAVGSGAAVSAQLTIQSQLTVRIGAIEAALLAAVTGLSLALIAMVVMRHGLGGFRELGAVPWWMLTGGFIGVAYILSMALAGGRIGIVAAISLFFASQLTMAAVIDEFGLLRAQRVHLTTSRAAGIALLIVGAALTLRK